MNRLHTWVLATKHNRYHPRILEPIGLLVAALAVLLLPLTYNLSSSGTFQVLGYATDITVEGLNAATNTQRANNGLPGLTIQGQLQQAAQNKAAHMFANNYWAHNAPDGTTPWSFINSAGYQYSLVGENLAKNFLTSSGVVTGWMNSAGHRANVLHSSFQHVGYGIMNGTLLGEEVTLVVALYGAPVQAPAAPAAQQAPPAATQPAPATPQAAKPTEPVTTEAPATEATPQPAAAEASPEPTSPAEESSIEPVAQTVAQPLPQPEQDGYSQAVLAVQSFAPVKAYLTLNWAQKASLFIIMTLGLLFVMKHTVIWRHNKRGIKHVWLRAHPLAQASVLGVAAIVTLLTGTGSIL
ncbi:MAG: CAP domain-containing protein [Candidatus Saccharimonadota bacterium]